MAAISDPEHLDGRQARFELKTLLDTSRLLIESTDPDFVMNNLLLIAMGKVMCGRAAIVLGDADRSRYEVCKTKGRTGYDERQVVGSPVTDRPETLPALFEIRTQSRHMGYLLLGPKADGMPYDSRETDFLENLVNLSAVAIANSLLVRELKQTNLKLDRKVQELHTLFELSKEFNATVDREPILRIFTFALLGQMLVRRFVFIHEVDAGRPELLATNGLGEVPDTAAMSALLSVADTTCQVDDAMRREIPFLEANRIEAVVRLTLQGESAVLAVGKRATGEPFTESDITFLSSLGNLALLSIQKTQLLQERIAKEKLEEELGLARTIQERLLPNPLPTVADLDMAAMNVPSQQVGGDYYDVIRRGDDLYLAIADVTGKGIPASLLMANLQAMLHVLTPVAGGLGDVTGRINDIICQNTPSDKFISFFWARYGIGTGVLEYVNAGHNPPFVFRPDGEVVGLSEGGMLLGALPTFAPYTGDSFRLQEGDVVVMYTDGVTEALNEREEEYGEDRLRDVIRQNVASDAAGIQEAIVRDVRRFTNDTYSDDITILVIKACRPPGT
jgi:sigma-B regulation protein RsbU (phosphoserine phosphatase)